MEANTLLMLLLVLGLRVVSCQPNMFIDGDFERFVVPVSPWYTFANDTPWYDISGIDKVI